MNVTPVFGTPTLSVEDVRFVIQNNRQMKKWKLLKHLNDQRRETVVKTHHLDYALNRCKTYCEEKIIECVSQNNHRQAEALVRFKNEYLPVKKLQKPRHDALEFRCSPPLKHPTKIWDDESKT